MTEFLAIVTSLPAAPFTLAAAVSVVWWAVSLTGGFGQQGEGHGDATDGPATDGHATDGPATDGPGHAEGSDVGEGHDLGDGHATDGHDADGHGDGDGGDGDGAGTTLASLLGLGKVPITLWFTLFSLFGWVGAFVAGWLARNGGLDLPRLVTVPAGLALGLVVGAVAARLGATPLAPLFAQHPGRERSSLVGEEAEVTTGRVDAKFGQARVLLGGDDLVVQIRCDRPEAALGRSARALIVGWDAAREAYVVEPIDGPRRVRARQPERPARS